FLILGSTGEPLPGNLVRRAELYVQVYADGQPLWQAPRSLHPQREAIAVSPGSADGLESLKTSLSRSVTLDANYLAECANYLVNNISTIDVTATTYSIEGYGEVIDNSGTWTGEPIASGGAWQTAGDRVYLDNKYAEITDDGSQPLLTLSSFSNSALPMLKMIADNPDNDGKGIIQFSNHDGSSIHEMQVTQDQWNFRGGSLEYNFVGDTFNFMCHSFNLNGPFFNFNGDYYWLKNISNTSFGPTITMSAGTTSTQGRGKIEFRNYDGSSIYSMQVTDDQWSFTVPNTEFNFNGGSFKVDLSGSSSHSYPDFQVQNTNGNEYANFLSSQGKAYLGIFSAEDEVSTLVFGIFHPSSQTPLGYASIRYNSYYKRIDIQVPVSGTIQLIAATVDIKGALDVDGPIYQRGTIIHPKRALGKDANLESIAEHAENMWREQRLPAVPAPEVLEDGSKRVELGQQRRGMLEELEKAHIYIQQLHEQNQTLQEQFKALQAQFKTLQMEVKKVKK
ncbi:MAG: hypothetical protein CR997_00960, partial [Acidobacteria bacterium]